MGHAVSSVRDQSILKPALLSMTAGTVLWLGLLVGFCLSLQPDGERAPSAALTLDARSPMTLDATGNATRVLHAGTLHAADFPLLHLRLENPGRDDVQLALRWRSAQGDAHPRLPIAFVDKDTWLVLAGQRHWQGEVRGLELLASGPPGSQLTIAGASLQQLTPGAALRSLLWHWTRTPDWSLLSVNAYRAGWPGQSLLQPALAVSLWLLLSVLSYAALRLARRTAPTLPVIGALFLAGWVALDLLWMHRLLQQHETSRATLAGRSDAEKGRRGQDSGMLELAEKVRAAVPDDGASRVFVVSDNDYFGMRSAYYLMPLNAYWNRRQELPGRQHLQTGDFILLVPPARTAIDVQRRALRVSDAVFLPVRPVTGDAHGTLFQVL